MPKVVSEPESLRVYLAHSLDLSWKDGDKDAYGPCLWCGTEDKFAVRIEGDKASTYRCNICDERGNPTTWLRKLHEISETETTVEDYKALAAERRLDKFNRIEALMEWSLARSSLSGKWLVPGYNPECNIVTLYQYVTSKRKYLLPTPTLGHKLLGMHRWNPDASVVYICEGLWDTITLRLALDNAKWAEEGLVRTSNRADSLGEFSNVIGIAACNTFFDSWTSLLGGKLVALMAHNDHPKEKGGKTYPSASYSAMERLAKKLENAETPPEAVDVLAWGPEAPEGYLWDLDLDHGYDARDFLTKDL